MRIGEVPCRRPDDKEPATGRYPSCEVWSYILFLYKYTPILNPV